MKPTNPKAVEGSKKVNLFLLPPVAMFHMAHGMMDGELKYGPYKFRETRVEASTYIAACLRHVEQWADGEECDPVSLAHHLGHAMACIGILLDAQAFGNLIDDRKKSGVLGSVINDILAKIKQRMETINASKTSGHVSGGEAQSCQGGGPQVARDHTEVYGRSYCGFAEQVR